MNNTHSEIHVALTFDENYITPLYALLTSLLINNRENNLVIHAIATSVNQQEKDEIKEYVKKNNGSLFFYNIDNSFNIEELNIPYLSSTHYTVSIFYRLFFLCLIPETIKKLLYLDTDIIVLRNLKDLYNTDISPFPAGVAIDTAMGRNNDPLLIKINVEKEKYFNSGVLLIDIDQWKKQKISEKTLKFAIDNQTILKFPDQDALNHVLKDNYYQLSNLYNFSWDDISIDLPKKEILKNEIAILHYTAIKPWKFLNHNRLRSYYYYYLKKSPQINKKKYVDFKWTMGSIKEFVRIRFRELYLDSPWIRRVWKNTKSLIYFYNAFNIHQKSSNASFTVRKLVYNYAIKKSNKNSYKV